MGGCCFLLFWPISKHDVIRVIIKSHLIKDHLISASESKTIDLLTKFRQVLPLLVYSKKGFKRFQIPFQAQGFLFMLKLLKNKQHHKGMKFFQKIFAISFCQTNSTFNSTITGCSKKTCVLNPEVQLGLSGKYC